MPSRITPAALAGIAVAATAALSIYLRPVRELSATAPEHPSRWVSPAVRAWHDAETARIRRHLETVEGELLARDISSLSPAQRGARARNIAELRAYRERGVFPINSEIRDERAPYFIDRYGTRCAMAHLIEVSGHGDFVARVAATRNNAYVPELAADPALVRWLEENGLTAREAARIQPAYGPPPDDVIEDENEDRLAPGYFLSSLLVSGLGGGSLALNVSPDQWTEPKRWHGWLGVTAGLAGMALASSELEERGATRGVAIANLSIGALSTAFGVRRLMSAFPGPTEPASMAPTSAWIAALSVAPTLDNSGRLAPSARLQLRF